MIRKAASIDATAIATIHVRTWQAAYAGIIPDEYLAGLSVEKRRDFWRSELTEKRSFVVVAAENEAVVGWASGGMSRDADSDGASEIYAIYVSPECWKRGIGSQLMQGIEECLSPYSAITLWVLARNERATAFYRTLGYKSDGAEKTIQVGGVSLLEVRLRKKTTSAPISHSEAKPS